MKEKPLSETIVKSLNLLRDDSRSLGRSLSMGLPFYYFKDNPDIFASQYDFRPYSDDSIDQDLSKRNLVMVFCCRDQKWKYVLITAELLEDSPEIAKKLIEDEFLTPGILGLRRSDRGINTP